MRTVHVLVALLAYLGLSAPASADIITIRVGDDLTQLTDVEFSVLSIAPGIGAQTSRMLSYDSGADTIARVLYFQIGAANVRIQEVSYAVPEPASWALLGLDLTSLLLPVPRPRA